VYQALPHRGSSNTGIQVASVFFSSNRCLGAYPVSPSFSAYEEGDNKLSEASPLSAVHSTFFSLLQSLSVRRICVCVHMFSFARYVYIYMYIYIHIYMCVYMYTCMYRSIIHKCICDSSWIIMFAGFLRCY